MSQLGTYLLQGLNQGQSVVDNAAALAQHQQALAMQQQELQQRQDEYARGIAQEHAAQQGLITRYQQLNPEPPANLETQGPPDAAGNYAPTPNPAYTRYQADLESFRQMPSHALQGVVGEFEAVDRNQKIQKYHQDLEDQKIQKALQTIQAADRMGHGEWDSPTIAGLKWVLGSVGYKMPLQTDEHLNDAAIDWAYKELGMQRPTDPHDIAGAQQGDPGAIARLNNRGHSAVLPYILPRKGTERQRPQFTADMVRGMYPNLTPEQAAATAETSNQAGRFVRPPNITLNGKQLPTRAEAETRAEEIMKGAGIQNPAGDPDSGVPPHPGFGFLAYAIENRRPIDDSLMKKVTAGGDEATKKKMLLTAKQALARDAAQRMRTADSGVNAWNRGAATAGKPLPPALEAEQRQARRDYETAHDEWEQALDAFGQPEPGSRVQSAEMPAPGQPHAINGTLGPNGTIGAPTPSDAATMASIRDAIGLRPGIAPTPAQRMQMKAMFAQIKQHQAAGAGGAGAATGGPP